MQFVFPQEVTHYFGICESVYQLRQMIVKQITNAGLERKCRYNVVHRTQKAIYAYCSFCKAFLQYKLEIYEDKPTYVLKKYENNHTHSIPSANATKRQKVLHYLRSLPSETEPNDMKKFVLKNFNVSKYTFYRALHAMQGQIKGLNFKMILPYLEEKGHVMFEPFPIQRVKFFPQVCLYVSNSMKKKFLQYGRFMAIDFTYNLIKEHPYVQESMTDEKNPKKRKITKWITGLISGLDSARRICVYGMAFCYSESISNIQMILQNFFDVMGKQPQTILSDQGLGIVGAIENLQKKGVFLGTHLFDAYHIMSNLKMQYENRHILRKLYLAADEEQFHKIFQSEMVYLKPSEQQKLGKFYNLSHKFCLSRIPPTFVALGCSTSMSQKLNDIFKTTIPRETTFSQVFLKLAKKSDQLNDKQPFIQYQTYAFENVLSITEIKDLRSALNKHVFQRLMREAFKTGQLEYQQCRSMCNFNEQEWKWYCACNLQIKTGLPCKHILKILICNKYSVIRQIDLYWIVSSSDEKVMKKNMMLSQGKTFCRLGKPRNSRRNIKK